MLTQLRFQLQDCFPKITIAAEEKKRREKDISIYNCIGKTRGSKSILSTLRMPVEKWLESTKGFAKSRTQDEFDFVFTLRPFGIGSQTAVLRYLCPAVVLFDL